MRLIDFFDKGYALHPDAAMFVTPDGARQSYRDMHRWSLAIAAAMAAAGSRAPHVGVYCHNDPIAFAPILGAWRAGGVWVPINARNALDFNADFMNTAEAEWLFYHSRYADLVPKLIADVPTLKHLVCLDRDDGDIPSLARFVAAADPALVPDLPEDAERPVGILPTGGTTGKSKGVLLTDRAWETMISTGWHIMPTAERPVHLLAAAMTHAAGILAYVLAPRGATSVVIDKVDPVTIMQMIQDHRVTHLFLPPTALYSLLAHPDVRKYDYSSLRYFLIAAAPVSPDKLAEAVSVFGPCMCECWAQAESPFFLTWLSPAEVAEAAANPDLRHRLKSCGRAVMLSRVEIIGEDGSLLGDNQTGEMCMKGNLRMAGYYKNPEATSAIRDAKDWQHTGDVGYRDADGYFYIVDRMKDMIISGGFNIFSAEVENAMNAHPAVRDCAVYAVPSEKWGEAVHASVELKPGQTVGEDELIAFAKDRLGGMKAPKSIDFVEALPRSPVGKVLKRSLRDRFWSNRDRAVN